MSNDCFFFFRLRRLVFILFLNTRIKCKNIPKNKLSTVDLLPWATLLLESLSLDPKGKKSSINHVAVESPVQYGQPDRQIYFGLRPKQTTNQTKKVQSIRFLLNHLFIAATQTARCMLVSSSINHVTVELPLQYSHPDRQIYFCSRIDGLQFNVICIKSVVHVLVFTEMQYIILWTLYRCENIVDV